MKKVFMVLICLSMVFAVACSKSKKHSPCDGIDCDGHGTCDDSSGRAICECEDGYVPNGKPGCDPVEDPCEGVECKGWQECRLGDCVVIYPNCDDNDDCRNGETCDPSTHECQGPCFGVDCNGHGECHEGTAYGSGYGSGSSYQSGSIYCECKDGYRPETIGEIPTCIDENCSLECGEGAFCNIENGEEYCKCINDNEEYVNGECVPKPDKVCDLDCGFGQCIFGDDGTKKCECYDGYVIDDESGKCVKDMCRNVKCEEWEICKQADGDCIVVYPNCNGDDDCHSGEVCDLADHECVEDKCDGVNCGNGGVCTVESAKAVCNCPDGYYDNNTSCAAITSQKPGWIGVQWPFTVSASVGDDPEMIYGRIWVQDETGCPLSNHPQHSSWKAQLGYKKGTGSAEYPVIAGSWTWIDANFNSGYDCADGNQNHEYMIPFPTDKDGNFIYIFRFSLDNGETWWYADKGVGPDNSNVPGPGFITSPTNYPGKATITKIEIPETLLTLDSHEKTANSYSFTLSYHGTAAIDFAASVITLNGVETSDYEYDETTKTFTVSQSGLEPNKYSWLFRLVDENGDKIEPFFVPLWIGEGVDYADFGWRDAFVYQIMTDRFLNGDTNNDVGNLSGVTRDLEQWKGGDFRGIIKKIDDGYFTKMGVNAIWISTPVANPHHTSQGGTSSGQSSIYFTSYHAYHPLATGYSFDNDYGFDNEGVDTAFGTVEELRELIGKAHKKGIRVIPDFVVNHVYIEAPLYQQHKNDGWFYAENSCADQGWADNVIKNCWFTPYMPDFNYNNADARKEVIKHAIWLIENFNFDGFRADALKHIDDIFVKELRLEIKEKIETTVANHDMPDEAEVFYMVGESLGGDWARYHTRADMVQGQVNDKLYYAIRDNILHNGSYSTLAGRIMNDANGDVTDTAFLTPKPAQGGTGGFAGAVMGNFFGNHDQDRALSECNSNYTLLKHAQTFLLTTPINIPMLYQGDDIGMTGRSEDGFDGGRRAVMKFDNLSNDEKAALQHVQRLGTFRKAHPALRKGTRSTCESTNDAWVYKFTYEGKTVIVGINKGSSAYNATCSGVSGSFTSYDGSTVNVSNGSVTVPAYGSLVIGN